MGNANFITQLLAADDVGRAALIQQHTDQTDVALAWALKAHYDELESTDPTLAAAAATTLTVLSQLVDDPPIAAIANWTQGLAALDLGQLETAHSLLTLARDQFVACQQPLYAASTEISNFSALAMLGRDAQAIEWGEWARAQFEAAGDRLATGKIEQNLANLHFIRDRYYEAEVLYRSAYTHFAAVDDQKELAAVENNLATTLTAQYKFNEVGLLYERALARAEAGRFETTLALLERNVGCLALFQGRFERAIDYLERSRRRYAALQMAHESAVADQEMADAYLELNLAPEAAAIYARVTPLFAQLGLRAEQARALAYHGRAALLQNQIEQARWLLADASALYRALGNTVGEAMVLLYQANADFLTEDFDAAATTAQQTEATFAAVNAWGRLLQARWLRGEALRQQGDWRSARVLLEQTLQDAQQQLIPQIAQRCFTSLGQLAMVSGEPVKAEAFFKNALELIEGMRAPLPAETFRIAFLSDKLTPYFELVRLCLADGSPQRMAEALGYVERARTRALLDRLGDVQQAGLSSPDSLMANIAVRMATLREELNWLYSQLNRPDSPSATRGSIALADLHAQVQQRETMILELMRQRQQSSGIQWLNPASFDLAQFQSHLGADSALVEYFSLDNELLAFVVTEQTLNVVNLACSEEDVQYSLHQFHFQLEALRYGGARIARHQAALVARANHHLAQLYDQLLRPIAPYGGARRLLVAPHRALHYVPFHALFDGERYVVEAQEICYTPSAAILQHCLAAPRRPLQQALLLGLPDEAAPRIYEEITSVSSLFSDACVLMNEQATSAALAAQAPMADLLHLACHGRFRADNPLFSALQLGDGWFTVHDAAQLNLRCNLVTLSACETGLSTPAPGDELLGLVRGFLLAGAPALLVSLWTVDDAATAQMMTHFYIRLLAGDGAAAALRHAQRQLLAQKAHPFFWAPFILFGRWS
jgi:CHAT domain-containing protein